jgi:hypothetical protein
MHDEVAHYVNLLEEGHSVAVPADINDVGFGSMTIKLMGVEGPKEIDNDEKFTRDLLCTPIFVTPNSRTNAALQSWSTRELSIFYFLNFKQPYILDFLMQSLRNRAVQIFPPRKTRVE